MVSSVSAAPRWLESTSDGRATYGRYGGNQTHIVLGRTTTRSLVTGRDRGTRRVRRRRRRREQSLRRRHHDPYLSLGRPCARVEHRRRLYRSDLVRPCGVLRDRSLYVDHSALELWGPAMVRIGGGRAAGGGGRRAVDDHLRPAARALLYSFDAGGRRGHPYRGAQLAVPDRRFRGAGNRSGG